MKNILGNVITLTLFGESHGPCVGGVIDGLPPGLPVDMEYIMKEMDKRRASGSISTPRREADVPVFLSGVKDGFTEGTPVAIMIENKNTDPSAYKNIQAAARPGHADYAAQMKYLGFQDVRGGGHFSGRLTAAIVAAGAIVRQALERNGVLIGSHISELGGIKDRDINWEDPEEDVRTLNDRIFAVLDDEAKSSMIERIVKARDENDSVGGMVETTVLGLQPGLGEPAFGSLESELAKGIFSIGAVKGIEFGTGREFARMTGSEANDPIRIRDGRVVTLTNNNGGINGGITNGMPVVFRTIVKPTPSIARKQLTIDYINNEETEIEIKGRHDPAIIHRARTVIDSVTALVVADLICQRHGYMWLTGEDRDR